jgi:hypothetical protein
MLSIFERFWFFFSTFLQVFFFGLMINLRKLHDMDVAKASIMLRHEPVATGSRAKEEKGFYRLPYSILAAPFSSPQSTVQCNPTLERM